MSLVEKGLNLTTAVLRGASQDYPYSGTIYHNKEGKSFRLANPPPENILDEIYPNIKSGQFTPLKFGLGIPKSEILIFHVAFSDQHSVPFSTGITSIAESCHKLINQFETMFNSSGKRPISIPEQLAFAMNMQNNNISKSIIALAIGTRAIARGYDRRLVPNLQITPERIKNWQNVVAPFGYDFPKEDPAGDTYHFWSSVLLGLSASEKDGVYNKITGDLTEFLARQTATATRAFRYNLFGKEGKTHEIADILGFETGKAIAQMYLEEPVG